MSVIVLFPHTLVHTQKQTHTQDHSHARATGSTASAAGCGCRSTAAVSGRARVAHEPAAHPAGLQHPHLCCTGVCGRPPPARHGALRLGKRTAAGWGVCGPACGCARVHVRALVRACVRMRPMSLRACALADACLQFMQAREPLACTEPSASTRKTCLSQSSRRLQGAGGSRHRLPGNSTPAHTHI